MVYPNVGIKSVSDKDVIKLFIFKNVFKIPYFKDETFDHYQRERVRDRVRETTQKMST